MTKRHQDDFQPPSTEIGMEASAIAEASLIVDSGGEMDDSDQSIRSTMMLVSVRDRSEWRAAMEARIDVIDLKEPRLGPLAPVDPMLWHQVCRDIVSPQRPHTDSAASTQIPLLSAALGESHEARGVADQVPGEFAFAKVGPSGCDSLDRLRQTWGEIRGLLSDGVELVAVAYADHGPARCLEPEVVFEQAAQAGLRRCLVDTFTKDGQSTLDHLGYPRLRQLAALARDLKLWWTLAGAIRLDHLSMLKIEKIKPDCFGVRGDVCQQERTSTLDLDRVQAWRKHLQEFTPQ